MSDTKQAAILRPAERPTIDRGNGARTTPLVTRACGSTTVLNGITAFDPGAAIGLHQHDCEESVMVLDGDAICEIDGAQHRLSAGDTTWLPPGVPHRFLNASDHAPMRIFWTYASVDCTRTLIATGETRRIDVEQRQGGS
ncbi:MAG: cupin domain-containing protein [Trueperaceae bacterium]|nr:cupin domain-containing protein [Trueperaceae bacterium]